MRTLAIDIETYSSVSLKDCGVYAYAASPDFDILLFGYTYDEEPVRLIDLARGEQLPPGLVHDLTDPEVLKTAFNANFERVCLAAYLHREMPPEQWQCTMVMASELGLPMSLAGVGRALGLPEDERKSRTGKALIRYFSIPGPTGRRLPVQDPERWELYRQYNMQDVIAERNIRRILTRFRIDPHEWELWQLDQRINDRGIMIDRAFAAAAAAQDEGIKAAETERIRKLTGIDNPKSTAQVKTWLADATGQEIASLRKDELPRLKEKLANHPQALALLSARGRISRTSSEKYKKILAMEADGRLRGLLQFYGAARTGRWSGRLVQPQNLPQNHIPDLDTARRSVCQNCVEDFYEDPTDVLAQLIRTAFIPRAGHKFIVADFSAIEARVLAWLADETWRQEVFAKGGDIYCASASQMFHVPVEKHGQNSELRQKGKIAELALGYGGSIGAMKSMMKGLNVQIPEEELKPIVDSWRKASPHIVAFWWQVERAVMQTIGGSPARLPHGLACRREGPLLRLRLPSGRELAYVKPKIICGHISFEGTLGSSGGWTDIETYGPTIVENITQAVARDCLATAMERLTAAGLDIVCHVHDEVIIEAPKDADKEDVSRIMGEDIPWAPGLLLRADAYECPYYRKE